MMKRMTPRLLITMYLVFSLFSILSWPIWDDFINYTGGSSLVYAFQFGVSYEGRIGSWLAVGWIIIYSIGFILSYMGIFRKKYTWFMIIMVCDICASLFSIFYKIRIDNQYGMTELIAGTIFRTAYFFLLILLIFVERRANTAPQE